MHKMARDDRFHSKKPEENEEYWMSYQVFSLLWIRRILIDTTLFMFMYCAGTCCCSRHGQVTWRSEAGNIKGICDISLFQVLF